VPVDRVRVITNIFSGNLDIAISKEATKRGAKVTLLIGPGRVNLLDTNQRLKIVRFRYFEGLLNLTKQLLRTRKYDIVVQSAAIADYTPASVDHGKIKSGQKNLIIRLKPTIKIIDLIKKIDPDIYLVKFKLEVGVNKKDLVDIAYKSMRESRADLIVANKYSEVGKQHRAYIIDGKKNIIECEGKIDIAKKLLNKIAIAHGKA
jgi:phosphopantothenoylcysteine decarboxylase/phosphopantothenate--cysteine ligase